MLNFSVACTFRSVDPVLGRLDYESLSDQSRMEMLISHIDLKSQAMFQDSNGGYLDVEEWKGVCSEENGKVTHISFGDDHSFTGNLLFEFTPPYLEALAVVTHPALVGTLQASALPASLKHVNIFETKMNGTVDMTSLPKALLTCQLAWCFFSGSCDLTALPSGLKCFALLSNAFSGSIDITKLPRSLEILNLNDNDLSGELLFENLPESLRTLELSSNSFCGSVTIKELPPNLHTLYLIDNELEGTATLPRNLRRGVKLHDNDISAIVDETGGPHPASDDVILSYF